MLNNNKIGSSTDIMIQKRFSSVNKKKKTLKGIYSHVFFIINFEHEVTRFKILLLSFAIFIQNLLFFSIFF